MIAKNLRRSVWFALVLALAVGCVDRPTDARTTPQDQARSTRSADRPNILFIFSDDHAPHAIGAYGGWLSSVNPTPNIDKLAAKGVLFENSFCTNSLCAPSRAVILTGKHSFHNGVIDNSGHRRFDGSQQTFPKLLRKAGYQTAIIGKWHLASDPTGFDYWRILPGQGSYYNPDLRTPEGTVRIEGHCTDVVTNLALNWLKNGRDKSKPFMLMCQHKAPHRNWMPAPRHLTLYDDITLPEAPTLFDDWKDNASPARNQKMTVAQYLNLPYDLKCPPSGKYVDDGTLSGLDRVGVQLLNRMTDEQRAKWIAAYEPKNKKFREAHLTGKALIRWKYQRYLKDYLRCIKGVDESVGQLMAYLKESGLDKNTIVIYSSDQGFYLGDHGWFDKRWMYEQSLKMPLIVYWPGVTPPGRRITRMVQNLDYAETFLDIAGAAIPKDMQGVSLVPLLKGQNPANWRDAIYYHYHEFPGPHNVARHYGIRTTRYKLMRFYWTDEWEFYDLRKDPQELTNQYDNPAYAGTIRMLKKRLDDLRRQYDDETDLTPPPMWKKMKAKWKP